MNLGLEAHAYLDSPVHRWDARQKLIGLAFLIFAFSFVQDLRLLPPMLLVTAVLYGLSKLPLPFLGERLRYPGMFLLVVAVFLPLFSGQTILVSFGPVALRWEGFLAMLVVVTKFISILTLSIVLFGTAPFLTSIKAIRAIGLPSLLADMMLLSYRYLFEIGEDLHKMQVAMRLRGFQLHGFSRRTLETLTALAGTILVRSYERSDRVYRAMILRGYGQARPAYDEFKATPLDRLAAVAAGGLAVGFVLAELGLRGTFGG
ncbi:MAG: cobalt ECF transporter T component CbiQ [Anaerolineales bacterium]|nr:cobalt ECF transporter T component CbiQ [Anaerolineales bacterium]